MKEDKIYLEDILESIKAIEAHVSGIKKSDFIKDIKTQDAVVRRFEIIGEAVKALSNDIRDLYLHVPWSQIAGMRDNLIHEYKGVDLYLLWSTVKKNMPVLKKEVEVIIKNLKQAS